MRIRHFVFITLGPLVVASALAATKQGPVGIPFTLEGAKIVVKVELTPGHILPFAFDSGLAPGNIITAKVAKTLGLQSNRSMGVRDASGDRSPAHLTTVPSMRVGNAKLSDQLFAILTIPDSILHRPGKPSLAGFLGAPLMKDAVVCIDYQHRTMQRWVEGGFDASGLMSVPMTFNHGLPTIIVNIDGRLATMIVDSGNDGAVVVYDSFAVQNDFHTRYPQLVPSDANSGDGQTFEALTGEADSIKIGLQTEFRHVPLTVIPQGIDPAWGIDGTLGFKVLSRLNPCLDREGQRFLFAGE